MYTQFLAIVSDIVSKSIPSKTVVLGPKDPEYITPLTKSLLKQRNRLRRRGQLDKADALAEKINALITNRRAHCMSKLSTATTKELWAAVNKTRNARYDDGLAMLHNSDTVNNYFAKIASKEQYDPRELDSFICECDDDNFEPLTNFEVEQLLSRIKLTAAGCDGIPAWLLRSCSYELADIVAHILNCSFSTGKVPSYWLNALVTPVIKVSAPIGFSDFRPISVTPHLSRIAEKVIVRRWLQPAIPADKILDQFAFKPSGSTTAALVYFTHQLTKMLEQNDYVRCLMIDFTKAFDTVDHVILLHKLSQLSLPGFVINWICSFLSGRGQQCKVNGLLSNVIDIGLSIVQGSGIGPTLYIVMKNDLCAVSAVNDIFKYADDTTLLVPQHTDVELDIEFQNVKAWAANNCLKLNLSKTKEIIFKRPRVQYFHMPPALDDIEQLDCCKLLGVIFQSNFKMDSHIEFILSQCAQRMYLLKLLRHQGLPDAQLSVVAYAFIISRLLYALPAWGGFLSIELVNRIDVFTTSAAFWVYSVSFNCCGTYG